MNLERQDGGGEAQVLTHSCQRPEAKLNEPALLAEIYQQPWRPSFGTNDLCFMPGCLCLFVRLQQCVYWESTEGFSFKKPHTLILEKAFAAWNSRLNISGGQTGLLSVSILNNLEWSSNASLYYDASSHFVSKRWIFHFNFELKDSTDFLGFWPISNQYTMRGLAQTHQSLLDSSVLVLKYPAY